MIINQAISFIRYYRKESILFILGMFLGLSIIGTVYDIKVSFKSGLESRSKELLGADLSLTSRVAIGKDKQEIVEKYLGESVVESKRLPSFFSMAKGQFSRLVWVRTLEEPFPYYGEIRLSRSKNKVPSKGSVWLYPELLTLLDTEIGGKIFLGGKEYLVEDVVEFDPSQGLSWGNLAPRLFMNAADLESSGLVQKGSTLTHGVYFKLNRELLQEDVNKLEELISDQSIRFTTPRETSEQMSRAVTYMSDFLSLISLVALFMSGSGLFYLFSHLVERCRQSLYLYRMLGLSSFDLIKLMAFIIVVLSFIGSSLSFLVSSALIPFLKNLIAVYLKAEIPTDISFEVVAFYFLLGPIFSLTVIWPVLKGSVHESLPNLFEEVQKRTNRLSNWVDYLPAVFLFFILSFLSSKSFKIGTFFFFSMLISTVLLWGIFKLLFERFGTKDPNPKHLWRYLIGKVVSRQSGALIAGPVALAISTMMINLVPQVQTMIQKELSFDSKQSRAQLFLFDIQDEQVQSLDNDLRTGNVNIIRSSPMIRGRLVSVNDQPYSVKTKKALTAEEEQNQRFRNRGINFSIRNSINEDEKILEGNEFSPPFDTEIAQISIEKRYAERMGLKLKDKLTFEILGVEVSGVIKNVREVKWTSMNPNFFIYFSPGVLNDAPKTHLLTINGLDDSQKISLMNDLAVKYPNISTVDITKVIERILSLFSQMMIALKWQTLTTLICGLFVILTMGVNQAQLRKYETALYKMLGISNYDLKIMAIVESFSVNFIAAFLGTLISFVLTSLIVFFFFDFELSLRFDIGLAIMLSSSVLATVINYLTQMGRLKLKPIELIT